MSDEAAVVRILGVMGSVVQSAIVAENETGKPGPAKTMSKNKCWADGKTIYVYCNNTHVCVVYRVHTYPSVGTLGALASRQLLWVQYLFMLY